MSVTYGGIPLVTPTPEAQAWIDQYMPLDADEFTQPVHRAPRTQGWPAEGLRPQRPIKLGCLHWPVGASRWAVGHFLASGKQLELIRSQVYSSTYAALPLAMDGGSSGNVRTGSISTDLYMLPPRPLSQIGSRPQLDKTAWMLPRPQGERTLYLFTLVDDRYFWWERSASIVITEGSTTWAALYAAIGSSLGVSITVGSIASAYLFPPASLSSRYRHLPELLDAVAFSTGKRIVRGTDGTVQAMAARDARASVRDQLTDRGPKLAGGLFAMYAGAAGA